MSAPVITAELFEWQLQGTCRGLIEDEVFFPDRSSGKTTEKAKRICKGPAGHPELACPVIHQCRDWALRTAEPHGVWGGLDRHERAAILGIEIKR